MNTLSIAIISLLVIILIVGFLLSRKALRRVLIAFRFLKERYDNLFREHEILKTQFRQLSQINLRLFGATKLLVKNKNEKNKSK
jgi:hypothetical protein